MKIFNASYMRRWNDKISPVDFVELDKQAHKMVVTYFLGKFEEDDKDFNWIDIIEGGLFEMLQRLVITDLKPPIFYKIKQDRKKYKKLNDWIFLQLKPVILPLGVDFCQRFKNYFLRKTPTLSIEILNAAHFYASNWEFNIIKRLDPQGYEIDFIDTNLKKSLKVHSRLKGLRHLFENSNYKGFVDLVGNLRFQQRWSHVHRIPKTSVLGHSLFVAIIAYLFSLEIGACKSRIVNNYFTGLFHDLPEILTRDIISPVKRSVEGVYDLIKTYEREQMSEVIYKFIPKTWHNQINLFTEDEFDSIIFIKDKKKKISSNLINTKYNDDKFNPRDGKLVKAADDLAAYIEAYEAINNGASSQEIQKAKLLIKEKYENVNIAGINFEEIYADFD